MVDKKTSSGKTVKPTSQAKQGKEGNIQAALYQIADAASAVTDMQSFYKRLHEIVGTLMYAENFFIALHDPQTDLITWPYYVDTVDIEQPEPITLKEQHGGTGWILRTGRTLSHAEGTVSYIIEHGEAEQTGTVSDAIGVPLNSDGKTVGVLLIQSYRDEIKYNLEHVEIMNFVAQHIAIALTRARATEETRQRNSELAIINSVQAALASQLDMHGIYEAVGEKLREIFNYQDAGVYSADLKTRTVTIEYAFEKGRKFERISVPMNSMYEYIVAANKTFIFNGNVAEFVAQFEDYKVPQGELPRSGVFVPVPRKKEAGLSVYLILEDVEGTRFFSASDARLLETLANAMSVALENARLFDETQQRNAELAILNSVGEAMSKTLDVKTVTRIVGDKVRDIFSADQIGILLFEQQTNLLHLAYGYDKANNRYVDGLQIKPIPLGKGLTSRVIESRQPLLLGTREEQDVHGHYLPPELKGQIKTSESWLGVPIKVEENVLGVVLVEDYRPHMYNENHLRLLQTLSSNMGVAIQNARLFDETQQRNAELAIINSVQEGLASKLEMQGIYDLVGDKVRDIFDANAVTLATFELDKNILHLHYAIEKGRRNFIEPIPIPEIYMNFIRRGQPLLINNKMAEYIEEVDPGFKQLAGEMPKSVLAVPLTMKGEMFGLITLQNMDRENAFSESDVRLLQTLTNSMSVALENARLFDETQRLLKETEDRNAELAIINSVQAGLASKLDMQGIYDLVGDKICEIFDVQAIQLISFDHKKNLMYRNYLIEKGQRLYVDPLPISKVWAYFINNPRRILLNDVENFIAQVDPGFTPPVGHAPRSLIAVPLTVNGELRGAIDLENLDRENAFSESDVRLLETLANSMSIALENARLWEQEKMFRKALQRELDIGREIQAGFLPETLPRVEGWEIAASLMSAREVAGDFYDAFELPDGTIGLVIADVCDKGVGAALFMTLFRSLIRAAANLDYFEHTENENSPHSTTERLQRAISLTNNYIAETHGESGMFATLFFGILDPSDGRLVYVNGGHESPLMVQSGTVRETLRRTGPAVGVLANARFDILETQMQPGEAFFAFTDGVPDCQNPRGEFFGRERLLDSLQRMSGSALELVAAMESELRQYIASANQFDDITLLAVKRVVVTE